MANRIWLIPIIACYTLACSHPASGDMTTASLSNTAGQQDKDKSRLSAENARIAEEKRIAAERRLERKEIRMGKARILISSFALAYMRINAPVSGEQPSFTILESTYNEDTETIMITFSVQWLACVQYAGCDHKQEHMFTGKLTTMGDTGQSDLRPIAKNDILQQSETLNGAWNDLARWLAEKERQSD